MKDAVGRAQDAELSQPILCCGMAAELRGAAPWVAGNIAYLKDLDYLENRLKVAPTKAPTDADPDEPKDPKGKKWKGRRGNKPKEESGDTATA